MLFERRFWPIIADRSVTVTFRRWNRPLARAGRRHRTPGGIIEVGSVDVVAVSDITDDDAAAAGYPDAAALVADLRGSPDLPIYRVRFQLAGGTDPRAELAATAAIEPAELTELDERLRRLDERGPWTTATLQSIAARPGVRAAELARELGRGRDAFKADVRKLKNLGLTLSLDVGYRLSPRGEAYLAGRHQRP